MIRLTIQNRILNEKNTRVLIYSFNYIAAVNILYIFIHGVTAPRRPRPPRGRSFTITLG